MLEKHLEYNVPYPAEIGLFDIPGQICKLFDIKYVNKDY